MNFPPLLSARFVEKKNRFVGMVEIDGQIHRSYIPNTGRLAELLFPGNQVLLSTNDNPARKTDYTLHLARKGDHWVSIDSHLPNKLALDILAQGFLRVPPQDVVQREVTYHRSRFDLYLPKIRHFIEVKGVTLEKEGWSFFPDAPTVRGTKHLLELVDAVEEGYGATVLFVVQLSFAQGFSPNTPMDPGFTQALVKAKEAGVQMEAVACRVSPEAIVPIKNLPITLGGDPV